MSRHDDTTSMRQMLDYARTGQRLIAGRTREDLDNDEMLSLATTRTIEVIGEAARRVSPRSRSRFPAIPWSQVTGTRDRLVHAYDHVDFNVLWDILSLDLPPLIAELERILKPPSGSEQR